MYRFLPAPILGLLLLSAITINTFAFFVPIFLLAIVKFAIPNDDWRHWKGPNSQRVFRPVYRRQPHFF